jgi:hypothetical protein
MREYAEPSPALSPQMGEASETPNTDTGGERIVEKEHEQEHE